MNRLKYPKSNFFQCLTHLLFYMILKQWFTKRFDNKSSSEVIDHFQGKFSVHCGFLSASEQFMK